MIEINLLPGARRTKSSARQPIELKSIAAGMSGQFRDRYLVISGVVTVIAVAVGLFLFLSQTSKDKELAIAGFMKCNESA